MLSQVGHQDPDVEAKLKVLQEIKDLMDGSLGDKMKGMSVEKVSVLPKDGEDPLEEKSESPEMELSEHDSGDEALEPGDLEKLKMLRHKMMG